MKKIILFVSLVFSIALLAALVWAAISQPSKVYANGIEISSVKVVKKDGQAYVALDFSQNSKWVQQNLFQHPKVKSQILHDGVLYIPHTTKEQTRQTLLAIDQYLTNYDIPEKPVYGQIPEGDFTDVGLQWDFEDNRFE